MRLVAAVQYHTGGFPPANLDWQRLLPLIGPAHAAIASYQGVLHGIPNAGVLLSPLTTQEAVLSSKIEGTQATMGEVLEFEAAEDTATGAKRDDIQEVLNYRRALHHAGGLRERYPLSQRVVRETHRVLMEGVRGSSKAPGEYRRIQNWIGPHGSVLEVARYVPPGADRVPELMSDWEKYLHAESPDLLVQLSIIHAEFEAIHPFLDGNGRIGRLLVPLYLVDKGILRGPVFYVSGYLEANRDEYYDRLLAVSRDDDWTGWCVFFLTALTEQARENESRARAIHTLYEQKKNWILDVTGSRHAVKALDWFFGRPIFKIPDYVASVDIPDRTASRILHIVREQGMLRELRPGRGRRAAIIVFSELLNIAEGRRVS